MGAKRQKTFLREWRKSRGMSLQAVADAIGMEDHTSLSRVERGIYAYSQDLLERLAQLYGCEPADLLARDPTDTATIYSIWDHASASERRQIVSVAEALTKTRSGTTG